MTSSDHFVDDQGIRLDFIPENKYVLCLVEKRPAVIQRCTDNEVCWILCGSTWSISEAQFVSVKEMICFFF